MIEISISEHEREPITTSGPHSPEGTRAIAAGIDEAFRLLNYATMNPGGLVYPSDVYSILGELTAALAKFPQALHEMSRFIGGQVSDGAVRENPHYGKHGGDAEAAHGQLAATIRRACDLATELSRLLAYAQSVTAGLEAAK